MNSELPVPWSDVVALDDAFRAWEHLIGLRYQLDDWESYKCYQYHAGLVDELLQPPRPTEPDDDVGF